MCSAACAIEQEGKGRMLCPMYAIITGTTRGVGLALATELLGRGWQVTGIARGECPTGLTGECYRHVQLDLADLMGSEDVLRELVRAVVALKPKRIALVNNAGSLQPMRPLVRCGADELQRAMTLNTTTPMWLSALVLAECGATPLRIVNLSSGAASSAYPGWGAYCAGKAALSMVDRVLAIEVEEYSELAARDFSVLTYAPGVVATEMQAEIRASSEADFPRRARFVALHEEGQLASQEAPAIEIAGWLESSKHGSSGSRRFGA